MTKVERPGLVTDEILTYLDVLRAGGSVNMYSGGRYLEKTFGMTHADAQTALVYWMETFSQRHA